MTEPDNELIRRFVKQQDSAAFEALVNRHLPKMRRYALVITGSEADADDVVQEVLVTLFRKLSTFKGNSAFGTWLFQVVRNCGRDAIRRRKRLRDTDIDDYADALSNGEPDPGDVLHQRALSEAVYREISQAKALDRQLFYLRETEELAFPEIARVTGLPEGTVKARLWRFKAKVQQKLRLASEADSAYLSERYQNKGGRL